ncbi:MAG: hypothetical protein BM557_01545 [Flavobacterium sp. MedPE-SWcel]|uniref:hypothetical protein n=1 Tax=uncultured Flavobacterium sp. TaxID=165435 RepID=UPI00091E4A3F|nr:hypothetical protein [uncultured Flavobacterium sp.]OIQ22089.1 MAG: hypothetical protein BM557_01545 [Flavobacterium sp. MedPE-SWcel]
MIYNKDNLDNLFNQLENSWDTEEPAYGHDKRFVKRLESKKTNNKKLWLTIVTPIAATIAILLGVFITYSPDKTIQEPQVAELSPEVKETQLYFASIIKKEMEKVEKESTPETKKIVQDALYRMEQLEKDYDKLTLELSEKGENKRIIHAMITNLQIRISFLEEVLIRIENIKKIKNKHYENAQA